MAASAGTAAAAGPAPNWTGFYVGGHLGGAWSDYNGEWDPSEDPGTNFDHLGTTGFIGGLQGGYNYQFSSEDGLESFVFGAEVDFSAIGGMAEGDRLETADQIGNCNPGYTAQCGARVDGLASLRARLGFAVHDFLPYATIGVGKAIGSRAFVGSSSSGQTFEFTDASLVLGIGFEWMATESLVLGAEYLYHDFNEDQRVTFEGDSSSHLEFQDIDVLRARVSWRIGTN